MENVANQSDLADLRREVDRITSGKGAFQDITQVKDFRAFTPAPPDERLQPVNRVMAPAERIAFGRWLLQQKDRGDWIDGLAAAARADPRFPKEGDPEQVRKRLTEMDAEGDMFEALDDGEMDWLSM